MKLPHEDLVPARRRTLRSATHTAAWLVLTAVGLPAVCMTAQADNTPWSREVLLSSCAELMLDVPADVVVRLGATPRVRLQAEPAVLKRITVRSTGPLLSIRTEGSFSTQQPLRVEIECASLRAAQVRNAAHVEFRGLKGTSFALHLDGAGSAALKDLNLERLQVDSRGSGDVDAAGYAGTQHIRLEGAGNYLALELASEQVQAELHGAGNAEVQARRHLEVLLRGAGSLRYRGRPRLRQQVEGSGEIERIT